MGPVVPETPYSLKCPKCGAPPGYDCHWDNGPSTHHARVRRWLELQDEADRLIE